MILSCSRRRTATSSTSGCVRALFVRLPAASLCLVLLALVAVFASCQGSTPGVQQDKNERKVVGMTSQRKAPPPQAHMEREGPGRYGTMESLLGLVDEIDPELAVLVRDTSALAHKPSALSPKTTALMALLVDMILGHDQGVRVLARQARSLGVTDDEIKETIRLAYLTGGLPALMTGLAAFID